MIDSVRDDAMLVASELATNAVLQAGADPGAEIEICAELVDDAVRISVADGNVTAQPFVLQSASEPGGETLSLGVVQAVARRWGRERWDGERVWAELVF